MSDRPEPTGQDLAHEEFVNPGPLPAGANLEDAEARLLRALEGELGVKLDAPAPPRRAGFGRMRGTLALAAAVAVAAGLLWRFAPPGSHEERVLRGAVARGAWDARPHAVPLAGGAGERLAWSPAPGATRYAVIFLGEDLGEIARVDSLARPELSLARGALPAGLAPGRVVLWRVSAYAGGDELARSTTSPLTLP